MSVARDCSRAIGAFALCTSLACPVRSLVSADSWILKRYEANRLDSFLFAVVLRENQRCGACKKGLPGLNGLML